MLKFAVVTSPTWTAEADIEIALQAWARGARHLDRAPSERSAALERVSDALVAELRRRLGGSFSTAELVALYGRGTSWCLDIAARIEPDRPWAWEAVVAEGAFYRYLREARDFAGGRMAEGA